MGYLLTGATGFIGRHLLGELLGRGAVVHVLVRPQSRARLERLAGTFGIDGARIVPLEGDLEDPLMGLSGTTLAALRGQIRHFFHLGGLYDLGADATALERINVLGTVNAVASAEALQVGCFHHISSIAVAGSYPGRFTERMFEEACGLDHPYFRSKHDAEALVRQKCRVPWRIYRPGMVVGHSATGLMDKIDGPYYFFKPLQRLRDLLPRWVPLIGFTGGHINLVPVDFVVAALHCLGHTAGLDGRCFHLTDPRDRRVGEVLNVLAEAAHAPTMALRLNTTPLAGLAPQSGVPAAALASLQRILERLLADWHIPPAILALLDHPTVFDAHDAQAVLEPAHIRVPRLEDYAWRLWDYWERQLDDPASARGLSAVVRDKTVLITGGSSGIGQATALRLAAAGATLLIVARDPQRLGAIAREIGQSGGRVHTFACDLTVETQCEHFLAQLQAEHPDIDILINNAGRSIRRGLDSSYERFHDFERLMRINYFAAVRLTLAVLPGMAARRSGHIIGISSLGVLANAVRFAGYNASKAALEAFMRSAAGEYRDRGVHFTVINMPLVRTPMVAPTTCYDPRSLLEPDQAADLVCRAIVDRPERLVTPLGSLARLLEAFAPQVKTALNAENFRLYPDSPAAGGPADGAGGSHEAAAISELLHSVDWSAPAPP